MHSQTSLARADLELAEAALRGVLVEEFRADSKADAMALDRVLAHVVNMYEAISLSPERHSNVAKRLDDFATTASRMAGRNPDAAARLSRLSEALRAASARLRSVEASPPASKGETRQ
jgi:hypothetical protein